MIPVKSGRRKSRLSSLLGEEEREELAALLLRDVLAAVKSARLISSCYVVSSDRSILALAGRLGAHIIPETADVGVNSAVELAMKKTGAVSDLLVIPSDLPRLKGTELIHVLDVATPGMDVAIAPSMGFDGTNALFFRRSSPIRLSYDDDSFWNHLASAAREKLTVRVLTEPGLMFDVDSTEDLRRLARSASKRASARFARKALR